LARTATAVTRVEPEADPAREPAAPAPPPPPRRSRRWPLPLVVLLIGALVTGTLAWTARTMNENNEDRLLEQRVREGSLVLTLLVPSIESPLTSAAELAVFTNGQASRFRSIAASIAGPQRLFARVALWSVENGRAHLVTSVGDPRNVAPAQLNGLFRRAQKSRRLAVLPLMSAKNSRLGFAVAPLGTTSPYVVYGEVRLPDDRTAVLPQTSAFSDLDYAAYVDDNEGPKDLLLASTTDLPLRGRRETGTVPFGDLRLNLVVAPRTHLGGTFASWLAWIVLIGGVVLTIGAVAMTDRLSRRRSRAEHLANELNEIAEENRRLYAEQRNIAGTLQRALLPGELPAMERVQFAARYLSGVEGVDVGGDWYDVVPLGPDRVMFAVGDVSGRGLRAATIMAALRFAVRAYAMQGDDPATMLRKLTDLVSIEHDGHFATLLCCVLDLERHEITVASAGHPPPLLVTDGGASFLDTVPCVPVGVTVDVQYRATTSPVPASGTVIAYTDGLVERRREDLDVGLARLRDTAATLAGDLDTRVTALVRSLTPDRTDDDIAILGVQWGA
jgi:serine phosphatase RsbU (regulator of sigma subunit)